MLIYDRVTCGSLSFLLPQFVAVIVEEHSDGSIVLWSLNVGSKQNAFSSLETPKVHWEVEWQLFVVYRHVIV
jgi:hypothetical protein